MRVEKKIKIPGIILFGCSFKRKKVLDAKQKEAKEVNKF
jgi:hypothetical protein